MGDEVFCATCILVADGALDFMCQSIHQKLLLMISEITKLVPTKIDVIKKDSDQVGIRNPNAGKIRKLSDMATKNVAIKRHELKTINVPEKNESEGCGQAPSTLA